MKLQESFKTARRCGVPLVAIETYDQTVTIRNLILSIKNPEEIIICKWDIVKGLQGLNELAVSFVSDVCNGAESRMVTGNPADCLNTLSDRCQDRMLIFFQNANRFMGTNGESVIQAMMNLREVFKNVGATLVLLSPSFTLPMELKQDVLVLTEQLPDEGELKKIYDSILQDAGVKNGDEDKKTKAVETVLGLTAFAAEQNMALSLTPEGMDISELWERKCKTIEQTKGLSVWRGDESFEMIGGCDNIKLFLKQILAGKEQPRCIAFMDEIDKTFSSIGNDTSGVGQSMLGTFLSYMQDKKVTGIMFIGPPGAAKTAIAKATGNEAKIPTLIFDLNGMKGSLVGESEATLRESLNVVEAISQNRTIVIATCNSISSLPPELRRRFTFGTFFFDLPTENEREIIWKIYLKKYELRVEKIQDTGWTGSEIRQCCDIAWRLNCSLKDASKFVIPVSKSAADKIETLRKEASGKYTSANYSGPYKYEVSPSMRSRKITVDTVTGLN